MYSPLILKPKVATGGSGMQISPPMLISPEGTTKSPEAIPSSDPANILRSVLTPTHLQN
jgi:hypothetical protein